MKLIKEELRRAQVITYIVLFILLTLYLMISWHASVYVYQAVLDTKRAYVRKVYTQICMLIHLVITYSYVMIIQVHGSRDPHPSEHRLNGPHHARKQGKPAILYDS